MTSFVLARDAKLGAPATTIALCPTMDLVVVACANGGTLTAFRLNWNKLWTKTLAPELETPTRATFRPDGKVLVVGYASGAITAHATEDGECLRVITGLEGFERDARDGASFERARYWAEELRKHGDARCRVLLVGNKIDAVRDDERATAREACEALAREYGMAAYRETSAKTGEGVQEAFEDVARAVMTREMSAREDATVVDA